MSIQRGWPSGRWAWAAAAGTALLALLTVADLAQHYRVPLGAALALAVGRALGLVLAWVRPELSMPWSLLVSGITVAVTTPVAPGEPWPWAVTGVFGHAAILVVLGARGASRRVLAGWWASIQLVGVLGVLIAPERGSWSGLVTPAVLTLIALVVGELLGTGTRTRQRLAEQEELTAAERAERALWQERARIARELHDVVAHHLSVVVVRADSAPHRLGELPEDARVEFAGIADEARSSLTEMRRVLRLLRGDGPPEHGAAGSPADDRPAPVLDPQPGLADVPDLVERTRRAGVELAWRPGPVGEVPPAIGLTAYRVVQEGISNAVRHAPGARIEVAVRREGAELVVSVGNGPPTRGVTVAPGGGHGLVGMRERVGLVDGRLRAERTGDGGYLLEAWLPVGPDDRHLVDQVGDQVVDQVVDQGNGGGG